MSIYRITENNVLVGDYEADNAIVLNTGQICLLKNNENIGVFNKNCSCYLVDDFYKTERELISE